MGLCAVPGGAGLERHRGEFERAGARALEFVPAVGEGIVGFAVDADVDEVVAQAVFELQFPGADGVEVAGYSASRSMSC